MLKSTFIHTPGIGMVLERRIWNSGVMNWSDFFEKQDKLKLSKNKKQEISSILRTSKKRLSKRDCHFFGKKLPSREHWRIYSEFKNDTAFLDIETTGLSKDKDITLIGVYDGKEVHSYILNQNLEKFCKGIQKYKLLVTYNGACFDLPFIISKFPNLQLNQAHIDLRWLLRRIGLTGGLKSIEHQLGVNRSDNTKEMSGRDAVRLWYRYLNGDEHSLKILVQYNKEDVVNLKKIIDLVYPQLINETMKFI